MNARDDLDPLRDLRTLLERIPSMLAYWGNDRRCRFANAAYLKWVGVRREDAVGRTFREVLGADVHATSAGHIDAALRGEVQTFERVLPGPDGAARHALASYIPDVVDGVVIGFVSHATELTQLKRAEAELRRERSLRADIERHAAELDRLLQERSEILALMAHEVRQPLHSAALALEDASTSLAALGVAEEHEAWLPLARARQVTGQVLARIDNTLAAATQLAGPGPIEMADADLDTLLAMAIADMPADERGRIHVERATATRTASMDMNLMRLALRNLLANALRYSPAGAPVTIRLFDSDEPLALVIEVADAGGGVEPELVPRLFERGTRGRASVRASGQGLGLYIVRRVMELHRGQVQLVQSGPRGSLLRLVIAQ